MTTRKLKLAVPISGRGSNLKSLIDATSAPDYPATIALVISNIADAPGLDYAKNSGIPNVTIKHKDFPDRISFDQAMTQAAEDKDTDLICLAGFMRLLSTQFVEHWHNRLINIHPSLLPAFKGLNVHENVIASGVRFSGCSVHYVRSEMDNGPIIAQSVVPVAFKDTASSLAERVLAQEHIIYPLAIKLIAEGKVSIINNTVHIKKADDHLPAPISFP